MEWIHLLQCDQPALLLAVVLHVLLAALGHVDLVAEFCLDAQLLIARHALPHRPLKAMLPEGEQVTLQLEQLLDDV